MFNCQAPDLLNSFDCKMHEIICRFGPVSASGPGLQRLTVSVSDAGEIFSIIKTLHLPAFPPAAVLHQDDDVQFHLCMQPHLLHTRLHSLHQGLGLLPAQALAEDDQLFTLDTVQEGDQATAADIINLNIIRHTGGQRGQVLSWD